MENRVGPPTRRAFIAPSAVTLAFSLIRKIVPRYAIFRQIRKGKRGYFLRGG
jgi:hypothetical protein